MKIAVFLIRTDSVTGKAEGEVYHLGSKKGVINCNVWSSPKLIDHKVLIACGKKAIDEVYLENPDVLFTLGVGSDNSKL